MLSLKYLFVFLNVSAALFALTDYLHGPLGNQDSASGEELSYVVFLHLNKGPRNVIKKKKDVNPIPVGYLLAYFTYRNKQVQGLSLSFHT